MDSSCLVPGLINCYIWRGMHNGWYFSGQQFCGVWWNSTPTKTRLVKTKESMSIPILTHTQQARKPQIEHSDGHYEEKICKKKRLFGGPNAEMPKNFRSVNRPKAWSGCLNTELEFPWKIKGFDFIPRRVISLYQSILLLFYEVRHPCYPNWFTTSFTIPVGRDRDQKIIT